ncbi:MAG: LysR family transcriptional regulator [Enterobacteriaceae bacterium]
MSRDRALTLEALRVMDAIERRGSFAAAAEELGRVPSALSYTIQKLEEDLDISLFDRSGHRTRFTRAGLMLLENGRVLLEAAARLTDDVEALARGWETSLTIAVDLVPIEMLFPLVERLAQKTHTSITLLSEVLAGSWERLEQGKADIVLAPSTYFRPSGEINSQRLYRSMMVFVAAADHPIHQEPQPMTEAIRRQYRVVVLADTAREKPTLTAHILDKQPRLTVNSIEAKRKALLAGLGIGSLPWQILEEDLKSGALRVICQEQSQPVDIIMAWRRDNMGEAKAWMLREIPQLLSPPSPK